MRPVANGGRRAVRVLSVTLAVVGGVLSLVVAWLLAAANATAAEGNPQWTTSDLVYVWVWVVAGVTVLFGAWLLSRRPWMGVCLTPAAAAVLFLNVALLHPTDLLVHFVLWCIVATPLLLVAALGAWRTFPSEATRGHRPPGRMTPP